MASNSNYRAMALLALVMVFWAGNSIVGRAVAGQIPPLTLAFIRWTGALLLLAPFAVKPLRRDWPELKRAWKPVLLLGLLGIGVFNSLLYSGLQFTTATNALLLQAAVPGVVLVLDRLLFGLRSGAVQIVGTLATMVGVVFIVFEGDPVRALALHLGRGDTLVLVSVLVWSLYTVFLKLRPQVAPVSFVAVTFAIGALANAPMALWEWHEGLRIVWNTGTVLALVYVALFPSLVSYFIYNYAAAHLGAARAGQSITMLPVFGAFLSALLLGEVLHWYHAVGIALIGLGIALGLAALRRQQAGGAPRPAPLEGKA
ncbi:DMT family transporter [Aurantiacibacter xanthus]|uniref:DMT family transporter n=1 Tax=Aurantiacibacter xanthus TaxID=1784712 RepID=A0A3A1PG39_9SPHN|nr:DMT family transporter [Aurantiacibacter xanthus]RIV92825.1 DMT family transporter [Aurantiacibacter xanthus]